MPYQPNVTPIGGQLIGQGLAQAGRSIGDALIRRSDQKRDRERASSENEALSKLIRPIGEAAGFKADDINSVLAMRPGEDPRVHNARLRQMAQAADSLLRMEERRQKVEAERRLMQRTEQATAQQQAAVRQDELAWLTARQPITAPYGQGRGVLRNPTREPTAAEMALNYARAGGSDSQRINAMRALADQLSQPSPFSPQVHDLGSGVRSVTTSRNSAVPLPQPEGVQQLEIGGHTYFLAPGNRYFDSQGRPVDFNSNGLGNAINAFVGENAPTESAPSPEQVLANLPDTDRRAYDWAKSNPNDPRSKLIFQRLGLE